jgi:CPA1 family monovalent cation:H+ antiporter
MSDTTRNHLDMFWELVDEILNAVLFLLMGLQIIGVPLSGTMLALGLMAAVAVLAARLVSVALPLTAMRLMGKEFERGTIRMMTWCGLRGGLSIAMALSIPNGAEKDIILPLTYIVVLFSILVQGLGFRRIMQLIVKQ